MKKSGKSKTRRIARAKRGYKKFERELKFKKDRFHNRALRKAKKELVVRKMEKVFKSINDARSNQETVEPITSEPQA